MLIFIDMDNTIAENQTCDNVEFTPGLYLNKRPIQTVTDAISTLYPDEPKVIVTKVQGGDAGIKEKQLWLQQNIPFPIHDALFITDKNYYMKVVQMDQYCTINKIPNDQCVLIDDSKQVLQYAKAYGFNVRYPQQIICDYEQLSRHYHL